MGLQLACVLLERALGSVYASPTSCTFHQLQIILQAWEPVFSTPSL